MCEKPTFFHRPPGEIYSSSHGEGQKGKNKYSGFNFSCVTSWQGGQIGRIFAFWAIGDS
jgi:hypothetical protein